MKVHTETASRYEGSPLNFGWIILIQYQVTFIVNENSYR